MEQRPLVVRCGAMGDMVILLSLIEALRRRFGQPVDVVTSGGWSRPLLQGQPGVGRIHVVGSRKTPFLFSTEQRQVIAGLRGEGPRPTWVCDTGHWPIRLLHRAGFGNEWIAVAVKDCRILPDEHHVDRWLRFAQCAPRAVGSAAAPLGDVADLRSPPLHVLPAWRDDLEQWLRAKGIRDEPLYLVQAGNKRTMRWWAPKSRDTNTKYWPEDRWAAVIRTMLAGDATARVILLGVPAEAALNDDITRLAGSDRVLNAARELPIPRLVALQARAAGMVSTDTGPAHSAGAVDCPLVVLFGEAKVARYAPRSPSGRLEVLVGPEGHRPRMQGITVADVESAWRRLSLRL